MRLLIYVLFFILFSILPIYADNKIISLDEFIARSVENNPDIFAELAKLKESEAIEKQSKAIYDIVFNLHYNRIHDKPFNDFSTIKVMESNTDNLGSSLQWVVPNVGTRIKGGIEYNRSVYSLNYPSYTPPFQPINKDLTFYNPEIFFEIQQPLLRNWLGIIDSFPIRQSKLNKLIARETVNESIEAIIIDLYKLYFDWYNAGNQYNIFSRNVINSETLLRQTQDRFRSGLSDRSDVSKTRILNIEYMKSRDLSGSQLKNISRKVYRWLTGSFPKDDEVNIIPERELRVPLLPSNINIEKTRQMRILNLTKDLLYYQLRRDESDSLPDLNLILSYKRKNYTQEFDKSINDFNYNNYTIGLLFNYPIGNSLSNGKIDETKSKLKKWDYDVQKFERDYNMTYNELMKTIRIYEKIIEYNKSLLEQARIQLREEEKKYQQGRSDLFFVIQYRNSLLNYELIYQKDYVDAKIIHIQLLGLLDEIKK